MANVDNSAWDASKAWANGAASDDPAAFYNGICAGKKAGDPKTQGAHALPHHYHPGDAPNASGVRNALSRLPQTDGLTNKASAQSHLDSHMTVINKESKSGRSQDINVRALRADARSKGELPGGKGRMASFPAKLRGQTVTLNDKPFYEVEGYATVFEKGYPMWDMFGPYTEIADARMLDWSLARKPDVAFLTNHKGLTMARTNIIKPTLALAKDETGLKVNALLNLSRQDVRDLASAIDDGLVDEMSFAFMLEEGEWNEEFTEFRLLRVDIDRGDVSAVNYGANPYTSIGARANSFLNEIRDMPTSVLAEAEKRMMLRDDASGIVQATYTLSERAAKRMLEAGQDLAKARGLDFNARVNPDPIQPVYGKSVDDELDEGFLPDDDATPDEDDDTETINGVRSNTKSTAELSVNLSDTDEEDNEVSADQRSAGDSMPERGIGPAVNLVRSRLIALLDDED